MNYTCEICGLEGFNDEEMRSHMVQYHLQGAANCPFCDLGEISPTEMLVHVNSAHLDYLTPRYDQDNVRRRISFELRAASRLVGQEYRRATEQKRVPLLTRIDPAIVINLLERSFGLTPSLARNFAIALSAYRCTNGLRVVANSEDSSRVRKTRNANNEPSNR